MGSIFRYSINHNEPETIGQRFDLGIIMLDSNEKITSLLVKLNKLTSLGQLQWHVEEAPPSVVRGTDDYIPLFMTTIYKEKKFALYQQRYQLYDGDNNRSYWTDRLVLAILDFDERILWKISEPSSALHDLFETARRKVADVDGIIDALLSDDEY